MPDSATRLRKFLLGDADIAQAVGSRVHQAVVPEGTPKPFIWISRTNIRSERCLGESNLDPFAHTFAVEAVAEDLDDAQEIAVLLHRRLDGYSGAFDDTTVQGIFVDEQGDDYESQFGGHVAALSVEVVP